jgi:hypothetical protein
MRTSEGGLNRAQRDHVALATARRASIEDARNPLMPTRNVHRNQYVVVDFLRLKYLHGKTLPKSLRLIPYVYPCSAQKCYYVIAEQKINTLDGWSNLLLGKMYELS